MGFKNYEDIRNVKGDRGKRSQGCISLYCAASLATLLGCLHLATPMTHLPLLIKPPWIRREQSWSINALLRGPAFAAGCWPRPRSLRSESAAAAQWNNNLISLRVTVIIRLLRCHCEEFWQADSIAAAAGSISLIRIRRQRLMISLVQIILVIDSGRQELSHQLQAETASG